MDVTDNAAAHRYEIAEDGRVAGFTQYRRHGEHLIEFVHTVVEPEFEGQGVGSTLIRHVLDAARREGRAVRPTCPFVRAFVERHPEYQDLLEP
jgi:predicted GNAT family acetyltransferase